MKRFTQKFFLLTVGMILSVGASAQEEITPPTIALKADVKNVVTITVGASASAEETVTTYYTTDDSDPSAENGTAITENTDITLGYSGFRVKAIAISTSGAQSDVVSFDFCYRGPWEEYEVDGKKHIQGLVKYKKEKNGEVYIIPAWDRRVDGVNETPSSSKGNGFVRIQRKADGKGKIVTAMGVWYKDDGTLGFNGQFQTSGLYVWNEKTNTWLYVTDLGTLQYKQIFNTGEGGSESYVFKDSSGGTVNKPSQVGRINPDYTVPNQATWLTTDPYFPGQTIEIDEIGVYAYGNSTYGSSSANRSIIEKLTIPACINKIGFSAFRGISTLEEVMIEDGGTLAAIPERCFDACWNLKKVELPSSITSIGGAAFGGCADKTNSNLNRIVFKSAAAPTFETLSTGQDIFTTPLTNYSHSNVDAAQCIIEVPLGAVNAYVASNEGYLATKKFPLCSKFPITTTSGVMTYCSNADFTFMKYNTSTKKFEAGDVKTYYIEAAKVEIENGKVILTEVTEKVMIPAWSKTGEGEDAIIEDFGVVLKGTSGTTYEIFYPNGRDITTKLTMDDTDNCLHGVITKTQVNALSDTDNSYFILKGGQFVRITKDGECSPNRAYIKISGGPDTGDTPGFENSQNLTMTFPDESTGITAHEVKSVQNDAWYTLQGIQVQQPSKGIFIKNGKKFVIK